MNALESDQYLPGFLSTAIKQYSLALGVKQSSFLTNSLVVASSFYKPGTKCNLIKGVDYDSVLPTLFGCLVGESGTKKTGMIKLSTESAFDIIQKNKNGSPNGGNNSLHLTVIYFSSFFFTGKRIRKTLAQYSDNPSLLINDCFSSFFSTLDACNLDNYYYGQIDSSSEGRSKPIHCSILAAMRPHQLTELIKLRKVDFSILSKFIFAVQPQCNLSNLRLLKEIKPEYRLWEVLAKVYSAILDLPVFSTGLEIKAYKVYQKFYKECLRNKDQSSHLAEAFFWEEADKLAMRLAFNLHVLANLASPELEISELTMEKAISLVKFYHGQLLTVLNAAYSRN